MTKIMSQMNQLYEKVARDSGLQLKVVKIMENHDHLSNAGVRQRLVAFADDIGFKVTEEEIKKFFYDMTEPSDGELSDADLEMVAGGKNVIFEEIGKVF
jgi:predicted ribosomally synthesized peptide with nif11-like leader